MIIPQLIDEDEEEIGDVFPSPPAEHETVPADDPPNDGPPAHAVRHPDGTPIGLQRYCELVTPVLRWDWPHMRHVAGALDKVVAGEIKRLIIEMPPRHGKTAVASIRFPAYLLELNPATRIIGAAHTDDLANLISRDTRRMVSGRVSLARDRNAVEEWETIAGGAYRAKGAGSATAGLPADYILLDDPFGTAFDAYSQAKRVAMWRWFVQDLYTRLESGGRFVLTMTRRHEDDLVGRIIASEEAGDWTVLRLPALAEADDPIGRTEGEALWPEMFDEEYLNKAKARDAITFASLYQQRPTPAEGLIFQLDWFRYYTTPEHPIIQDGGIPVPTLPSVFAQQAISVDCSFKGNAKSDYVAGLVGARRGADCYILPDHIHARLGFPATIAAIRALAARNPKASAKWIEDKANGPAVVDTLRSELTGVIAVNPEGDKVARASAITHMFQSGNVWFPHPSIAPWVQGFVNELLQFPRGQSDDLTDALTQLLRKFDRAIQAEAAERERDKRQSAQAASYKTYGA